MKNLLIALLMSITLIVQAAPGTAAPALPQPERNVLITAGEITAIGENSVTIAGKGSLEEIVLHIQPDTHIRAGVDGGKIQFSELKEGDKITAYYGPRLMKSLPPQGYALALITGDSSSGKYLQVAGVEAGTDGSVRVLSSNRDQLITIRPDVFGAIADIKKGSELLVWYDVMTMSMPGQAGATKVVALQPGYDIRVHPLAGVIVIQGQELPLHSDNIIRTDEHTVMLPLRIVAEHLGYRVIWSDEDASIELQANNQTVATLAIGSTLYKNQETELELAYPPEIVRGKTLVPVEFFTEVLQLRVQINTGHI
ncbi:stalk domain-containing protein [Sporomusa termitida]|uniref:Copper amine oxidase-like N-terminal domain-containing protein n=1 Tax=Sporomusa termitida TaxID=2377 RepID=A0A517DQE2_9FIRM|nr:stalk domain-containing protein [Sporomusa termitida]QDR79486.1 hypothetical protein SPTER_07610 [Sporomusa termitida]